MRLQRYQISEMFTGTTSKRIDRYASTVSIAYTIFECNNVWAEAGLCGLPVEYLLPTSNELGNFIGRNFR
jgi:hypothetical protein